MRIVVTRAESQAEPLAARLEALGHEVVRCPLIRIEPLGDEPVDPSRLRLGRRHEPERRRRARAPARCAAGADRRDRPGTADALAAHGLHADLVPRVSTQEGLLAELPRRAACCSQPPRARDGCSSTSATPTSCRSTAPSSCTPPAPAGDLVAPRVPSAARAFAATGARIPVVAIGPQTAAEARRRSASRSPPSRDVTRHRRPARSRKFL